MLFLGTPAQTMTGFEMCLMLWMTMIQKPHIKLTTIHDSDVFPEQVHLQESINGEMYDETNEASETKPIYTGHHLPIKMSVLLISLYVFSVPVGQLSFLLWLLNLHFLPAHPALRSVDKFKKCLAGRKTPLVKHFCCNLCLSSVDEDLTVCPKTCCAKILSDH